MQHAAAARLLPQLCQLAELPRLRSLAVLEYSAPLPDGTLDSLWAAPWLHQLETIKLELRALGVLPAGPALPALRELELVTTDDALPAAAAAALVRWRLPALRVLSVRGLAAESVAPLGGSWLGGLESLEILCPWLARSVPPPPPGWRPPPLPGLTRLSFNWSNAAAATLAALLAAAPRLRALRLQGVLAEPGAAAGGCAAVAAAASPGLRELVLTRCYATPADLRALMAAPFFSRLEELQLVFEPRLGDDNLRALCALSMPQLRVFKFDASGSSLAAHAAALAGAPWMRQLARLVVGGVLEVYDRDVCWDLAPDAKGPLGAVLQRGGVVTVAYLPLHSSDYDDSELDASGSELESSGDEEDEFEDGDESEEVG